MSLQSDNTSSGSSTGAATAAKVGMTQIWKSVANTTAVQYTVPDGKYFKGYVGHNSSQYFRINGVDVHAYFNNAAFSNNSYGNAAWFSIILAPGTTVAAASNSNHLYIHGCEFDIPDSGLNSTSF